MQRCPRNSDEQLGQIDEASGFGFAGAVVVSATIGGVVGRDEVPAGFEPKFISGVLAQIRARENTIIADASAR